MKKPGLTYNTEKKQIIISEYGRNIQEMIKKLDSIEDRKLRTDAARLIIDVMAQMNPQVKEADDYQHKLWDHLFIISDYKLDVDSPYPMPQRREHQAKPNRIGYQNNKIRYGHYGNYIIKMIAAASKEPNDEVRQALAYSIANQMKRNYLEWNKTVVNDQVIIDDLNVISKGRLVIADETKLSTSGEILGKQQQQQQKGKQQQQQSKKKKKKVPNMKANMNNPNNPAYKKKV